MSLRFCSFSSGSKGNCYLIESENTALLVDAGISARKMKSALKTVGNSPANLDGILITHEHTDHVKGLKTMLKQNEDLFAYTNQPTWEKIAIESNQKKHFVTGDEFKLGNLYVKSFPLSHDAVDPTGFSIRHEGKQISVVTDTGCLNAEILEELKTADILVLESNHDVDMLKCGDYPWWLKQRVLGEFGHLSNDYAAQTISTITKANSKSRLILLAHLSEQNNFPDMARQTIVNHLTEEGIKTGKDLYLDIVYQDNLSSVFRI